MRTLALITPALLIGSALCVGCTQPGQVEIARGNVLASRRDFQGAIGAYRAAGRAAPNQAHPREVLGHLFFDLGRAEDARAAYEEAVRVDPSGALEARLGLARLESQAGDFDRAARRLTEVLEEQPKNLYALLSRASVQLRLGTPASIEGALSDTARAMAIDEKNAAVLYLRGSSFLAADKAHEAQQAFELLEKKHPQLPLAWYGYARVASARGDKAGAVRHLRIARAKTSQRAEDWKSGDVLSDPLLGWLREDPEFTAAIGAPR